MVRQIEDFEYIRVANEDEAFSLESNLIKQFNEIQHPAQGHKHFPYVRVDLKQNFPRLRSSAASRTTARNTSAFLSGLLLRDGPC
jgi:excinuclease UvrABC nuclease subunit